MQDRVFKTIYLGDVIECMAQVFFTTDHDAPDASVGCAGGHGVYASIADAVVGLFDLQPRYQTSIVLSSTDLTRDELVDMMGKVIVPRDELAEVFGKADVTRAERIIEAQLAETLNDGENIIDDDGAEFDPADYAAPIHQIAAE
ncbi:MULTISPECIES: hypothetical protein [unclassified Phaeobacter]|uniref:hypothetical protein n=1 Tax=unclassified Phaeobacter TaxID=2621772 RepID=UPI003A841774